MSAPQSSSHYILITAHVDILVTTLLKDSRIIALLALDSETKMFQNPMLTMFPNKFVSFVSIAQLF